MTKTHGLSKDPAYSRWKAMIRRCYNPKCKRYHRYGGRGIKVCEEWRDSPVKFIEWAYQSGFEKHLTLDRADNNKGYSPENCRWVSYKVQMNNFSRNAKITINNITHTLSEWSEIYNIYYPTLKSRYQKGESITKLFRDVRKQICHGGTHEQLYIRWNKLHQKDCCDEWQKYPVFRDWMLANGFSKEKQIQRKDRTKPFSPENCFLCKKSEKNQDYKKSKYITYNNKTQSLSAWLRELNLSSKYHLIYDRLRMGWTFEDAIKIPTLSNETRGFYGKGVI